MSGGLWKRLLNRFNSSVRRFLHKESDEAFVTRLYQEMLGRPPEASALFGGTRDLGLGFLRRKDLRGAIASSPEYRAWTPPWRRCLNRLDSSVRRFVSGESDEAFATRLYWRMLHRPPDVAALSAGTRDLGLGFLSRRGLRKAIAASPEYRALTPLWRRSLNRLDSSIRRFASGESDEAFVALLYRRMLGRQADVVALAEGVRNLGLGTLRRHDLRRAIASSLEYRSSTPPRKRFLNRLDSSIRRFVTGVNDEAYMTRLYEQMLGRLPDMGALSAGTKKLGLGLIRRNHLRREISLSDEYRAVAAVRESCRRLLDRDATRDDERKGVRLLLAAQQDGGVLEREIRGSVEYWLRHAPAPAMGRSVAETLPEEIWLEITTRCNVVPACAMCGYASADPGGTRRNMDPRTWRSLLPLLRQARHVGLHGAGEPLLYPDLGNLMEALRSSPAVVGFNSNGHLLTAAVSRRLVDQGLGWISISLDAATPLTYLRIRRRADFEVLISKIRALREIRDAAGSLRPRIEINMTLMRLNLPEAPAFVELAARLRVDGVMFQEIQPGGAQRVVAPDGFLFDYREQELAGESRRDDLLDKARERARSLGLQFNCEILYGSPAAPEACEALETAGTGPTAPPSPACAEPWRRLLFNVDGDAFVCCIQKMNGALLGVAPHDPIDQIWNGRRARLVREAMFAHPAPSCCDGCYRTSGRGQIPGEWTLADSPRPGSYFDSFTDSRALRRSSVSSTTSL